jgi:hypothetical protein
MWRDLHEDWVSPTGRVAQVGDSAHSFLPSSGNGASQAMEDAITLATCLQIGGKDRVCEATKVYNKLRYVWTDNPAIAFILLFQVPTCLLRTEDVVRQLANQTSH